MQDNLYAKADGDRKPWYIVALTTGVSTGNPSRNFRIAHNQTERDAAAKELLDANGGTHDCHLYMAEGFWNIQG